MNKWPTASGQSAPSWGSFASPSADASITAPSKRAIKYSLPSKRAVPPGIVSKSYGVIATPGYSASTLPGATLCFMHPVKAPSAIREAYHTHGVKTFSLDSVEELEKIVEACRGEDGEAAELEKS